MADGIRYEFQEGPTDPEQPWTPPRRVSPLDTTYSGQVAPVSLAPRVRPQPAPPPAEAKPYTPTLRERAAASGQQVLERLGFSRPSARRTAQTVVGGPQSNLPLGIGLADIPLVPSIPFLMQEGYRGTERAMSAAERGNYGAAALEYLGAAAAMTPGVAVAGAAVPPVARVLDKTLTAAERSMGARAVTSPLARSQRGVFLPPQYFTPQEKARAATAQNLEAKGSTPQEVWQQTGLVRDFDGSWMVEVGDEKMRFKGLEAVEKARDAVVRRIDGLVLARTLRSAMDSGASLDDAKAVLKGERRTEASPAVVQMAQGRSVEQIDAMLENANASLMAPIRGLKYKDVVEHPELVDRIPEMAEMQVDFLSRKDLGGPNVGGRLDVSTDPMSVQLARDYIGDPSTLIPAKGIVAHEAQHTVDYLAGKPSGTSVESIQRMRAEQGLPPLSPEQAELAFLSDPGEARGRLAQVRAGASPEQRVEIFPFEQRFGGLDMPPSAVQAMPGPTDLSSGMGSSQRGAVMFGMGGEQARPLRDVLAEQPTTLRVLENLPGKRTTLTVDEIQQQMRRPEVTKQEKDVLERVLTNAQGGTISAEDLVRGVQAETGNFSLTQADTQDYATYGLNYIGRDDSPRPWVEQPGNAFNPRTTVHRSPMETGASSHFMNEPNYFAHSRAFEDAQGIPHVVEIQSDLVQKAGKELSPQERQNLESALSSVETQQQIYDEVIDRVSPEDSRSAIIRVPKLLENVLTRQADLDAVNSDAIMLLENEIFETLPYEEKMKLLKPALDELEAERLAGNADAATTLELYRDDPNRFFGSANLRDGELLSRIADGSVGLSNSSAQSIQRVLNHKIQSLNVLAAEHRSKLAEQATNAKLQPMFKNWERRVVREELARAAREGKPMVRFADADTVAAVEGWPRKEVIEPGTAFDSNLAGNTMTGSNVGSAADMEFTGNIRVDENGVVTSEVFPRDVTGARIGENQWMRHPWQRLPIDMHRRFFKQSRELEFPEHQGIYDRYNKEVANYLKSLDAKRVTDETGNTWWEVPVKPQQRRPQIFSMGGGIVGAGAAAYNAQTPAVEEQ